MPEWHVVPGPLQLRWIGRRTRNELGSTLGASLPRRRPARCADAAGKPGGWNSQNGPVSDEMVLPFQGGASARNCAAKKSAPIGPFADKPALPVAGPNHGVPPIPI